MGKTSADKANRAGGAERFAAPAVPKSLAGALALIPSDDALWRAVERPLVTTATPHEVHTLSLRPTVPGLGKMLRLVLLSEIPDLPRCPTGPDCVSSGRRGTWATESAGKRLGTSGSQRGKAHRTWALSDAAVLFRRAHPAAQKYLAGENT